MEFVPGTSIGHIPYADEDAADEFAVQFGRANPVYIGPIAPRHNEHNFRNFGIHTREN
jgi:hypothetical protein